MGQVGQVVAVLDSPMPVHPVLIPQSFVHVAPQGLLFAERVSRDDVHQKKREGSDKEQRSEKGRTFSGKIAKHGLHTLMFKRGILEVKITQFREIDALDCRAFHIIIGTIKQRDDGHLLDEEFFRFF